MSSPVIYQLPTPLAGTVGVLPVQKYMVVGDNFATVTAAGYLNSVNLEGYPIANTDIINALYSYNPVTTTGTFEQFSVSISNGVITLVALSNAGEVTLPTIANHIATYTNTNGHLSEDAATAINGGNIQAGLSGTAGTVASFPATASKGSLVLAAVANTGNTLTTISNAAMGQASVISIPDPAAATADFVIAPAALVSGNLVSASGTAGLVVDSGITAASISSAITQIGSLYQVSVTFNTAQMVTAYDTPLTIVPNPSASQMILVLQASVYTASTGHTAYATGTAPIIQYSTGGTNGQHGAGTIATAAGLVAGDITAAASQVRNLFGIATAANTGLSGKGLYFSNATGDYTAGTGTNITITVVYQLLNATV